ncbi:MAG TPA: type I-E CRISPR-associated endonuclease Cas1 [Candidatus Avisuccinivibrio pullicola]|nr:type I-E CRISPR-associated endonuclease Cas1 [Candidatus Avisuccinivibrio pullicola]
MSKRLFIKVDRSYFPQIKDRYPLLYLERGRLEVDDSSVKWIDCECNVVMLPIATISTLFLGPGTSVTHEALKTLASCNCNVMLVAENCFATYCQAISVTSDTRNMLSQIGLYSSPDKALNVARRLFAFRFPELDLSDKSLQEMMGIEGARVRNLYRQKAFEYGVSWQGRNYIPGKNEQSDPVNRRLTLFNSFLYGLCTSSIISLGYSPYIGFIHNGCPLPFTYDMADLYKSELSIDLAFRLASQTDLSHAQLASVFTERCCELNILNRLQKDIQSVLEAE